MSDFIRAWWVVVVALGIGLEPVAQAANPPTDPLQPQQSYLGSSGTNTYGAAGAEALVANGVTGIYNAPTNEKVIIAIIGDGVDLSHPDLDAKGVGVNHRDMSTGLAPTVSGPLATAMAGIAAAETDGATPLGIAGVCRDCRILNIRADTNNADPATATLKIAQAIAYAVQEIKAQHGTQFGNAQGVILLSYDRDLSLGSTTTLAGVLKAVFQQGTYLDLNVSVDASNTSITVVAPAGNGEPLADGTRYSTDQPSFPCSTAYATQTEEVPNDATPLDPTDTVTVALEWEKPVLCVGSADTKQETRGRRSVFSNYGAWVDVYAPGQAVVATFPPDATHPTPYYDYLDSTHAAAAVAAGIAARIHAMTYERSKALAGNMTLNTPAKIRELLWGSAVLNAQAPDVLNDRFAAEGAMNLALASDPHAARSTVLAAIVDTVLGVSEAWAAESPPAADLRIPANNSAVFPRQLSKGRNMFNLQAIVRGSSYRVELLRHDCGASPPALKTSTCLAHSYYALGALVTSAPGALEPSSLIPTTAILGPDSSRPRLLGKVCADKVVKGTTICTAAGTGALGTNYWEEGEYTIKLIVSRVGFPDAVSTRRLFVDRSFDSTFNPNDTESFGDGSPLVFGGDAVVHGPNLADVAGPTAPTLITVNGVQKEAFDGKPEIIVGSSDQVIGKRIYVFDGRGKKLFSTLPLAGPVIGTPAVGNVDADAGLEIVVTTNNGVGSTLYVFNLPSNLYAFPVSDAWPPLFQAAIGASKSSPALGKGLQSDDKLSIFVTTRNNTLQWWKWDTAAGTFVRQGAPADLTCVGAAGDLISTGPNHWLGMNHYLPFSSTPGPCAFNPLMESSPLVANLNTMSPMRVFVPSQDPLSTYGFDPQPAPTLRTLPGFPLRWTDATHPAAGGSFDSTLAYTDNDGELEMFDVKYELDARATCPLGAVCNPLTQCKGKLNPGDDPALLCNEKSKVVILEVQGATTAVTEPNREKKWKQKSTVKIEVDTEFDVPGYELFMYAGVATGDVVKKHHGHYHCHPAGSTNPANCHTHEHRHMRKFHPNHEHDNDDEASERHNHDDDVVRPEYAAFLGGPARSHRELCLSDPNDLDELDDDEGYKRDTGALETVLVGASGKVYLFDKEADLVEVDPRKTAGMKSEQRDPDGVGPALPYTAWICPDDRDAGWPQQMGGRGAGTPLIADLDDDGSQEIVTTSDDRLLYAWDQNGCIKRTLARGRYGFPRAFKSSACFTPQPVTSPIRTWSPNDILRCTTPAIGNIDADAALEMVAVAAAGSSSNNAIYVWDLVEPPAAVLLAGSPGPSGSRLVRWLRNLLGFNETAWATAASPKVLSGTDCGNDPGCSGMQEHATITGTITDMGNPITNATVTISWSTPDGLRSMVLRPNTPPANNGGTYAFDQLVAAQGLSVTVSASATAGKPIAPKTIVVGENLTYTVNLRTNNLPVITISPTPSFTMKEQTNLTFLPLTFQVSATDPDGDNMQLTIGSQPPLASFPASTTGSGTVSATFSWNFGTLSALFGSLGSCSPYTFTPTFNVWDAGTGTTGPGSFSSQAVTINLVKSDANHPPVVIASLEGDTTQGKVGGYVGPGKTIYLTGSGSCDPDGNTLTYTWAFVSRNPTGNSPGPFTDLSPAVPGDKKATAPTDISVDTALTFRLTVKDFTGGGALLSTQSADRQIIAKPGCFIATAAFGSPLGPELDVLRAYRDTVLSRSTVGRTLTDFYYRMSPPVARFIADKPTLRAVIRNLLKPIVEYCRGQVKAQTR